METANTSRNAERDREVRQRLQQTVRDYHNHIVFMLCTFVKLAHTSQVYVYHHISIAVLFQNTEWSLRQLPKTLVNHIIQLCR